MCVFGFFESFDAVLSVMWCSRKVDIGGSNLLMFTFWSGEGESMGDMRGDLVGLRSVSVRSRVDIMASILDEVRFSGEGSRKTRLMYRCNLSFRQLKAYLKLLCDKRFFKAVVKDVENRRVTFYKITDEGRLFLRSYDDLRKSLNEERLTR